MNLFNDFEYLDLKKSKKLVYEPHNVFYLKFDTHNRIALKINHVDIPSSSIKKFRGFFTRSISEEKTVYIQTDGNIAVRQIFCQLCSFLLSKLHKLTTLHIIDIEDAIKDWISFSKSQQIELNEKLQLGLFGELLFLKNLLEITDSHTTLLSWHGPERSKVDFIFSEKLAVEIKSLSDPLNPKISISSIQQLSDGFEEHYLRVYKLAFTPNGIKVDKLFKEILDYLSHDEKDNFINKCFAYGYNFLIKYDNLKPVSLIGQSDYRVSDEDFPKIISQSDPRIVELKYKISLDNIEPLQSDYITFALTKPKIL